LAVLHELPGEIVKTVGLFYYLQHLQELRAHAEELRLRYRRWRCRCRRRKQAKRIRYEEAWQIPPIDRSIHALPTASTFSTLTANSKVRCHAESFSLLDSRVVARAKSTCGVLKNGYSHNN
jgi:hypothetical protein